MAQSQDENTTTGDSDSSRNQDGERTAMTGSDGYEDISVYYMDYRNTAETPPDRSGMYTYTPGVTELLERYTFVGEDVALSVSKAFQRWESADEDTVPDNRRERACPWRGMQVGDIIVFGGTPYIVRPSGYDELNVTISS